MAMKLIGNNEVKGNERFHIENRHAIASALCSGALTEKKFNDFCTSPNASVTILFPGRFLHSARAEGTTFYQRAYIDPKYPTSQPMSEADMKEMALTQDDDWQDGLEVVVCVRGIPTELADDETRDLFLTALNCMERGIELPGSKKAKNQKADSSVKTPKAQSNSGSAQPPELDLADFVIYSEEDFLALPIEERLKYFQKMNEIIRGLGAWNTHLRDLNLKAAQAEAEEKAAEQEQRKKEIALLCKYVPGFEAMYKALPDGTDVDLEIFAFVAGVEDYKAFIEEAEAAEAAENAEAKTDDLDELLVTPDISAVTDGSNADIKPAPPADDKPAVMTAADIKAKLKKAGYEDLAEKVDIDPDKKFSQEAALKYIEALVEMYSAE